MVDWLEYNWVVGAVWGIIIAGWYMPAIPFPFPASILHLALEVPVPWVK